MATSPQFPCHEHPLATRELSEKCPALCRRCGHPVHGPTRCCLDCSVFFHKRCTEWPLRIQHPYHPQHQVTLVTDNYFTSKYCCHECEFSARAEDLVSTLPPTGEQEDENETVEHSSHEHPLTSFTVTTPNNIRCGACQQEISGRVYGCRRCLFLLHESCALLPREILQNPIHPQHKLVLVADSNKRFECNTCGQLHRFVYHCEECRINIDVQSAVSALPTEDQQKEVSSMVDHFSHQHPLKSFNIDDKNKHMTCKACQQYLSGDVYGCLGCTFFLHRSCAELDGEMYHFLHSAHRVTLYAGGLYGDGSFICNCCLEVSSGFVYLCEGCDFNLDPECAVKTRSALDDGLSAKVQHFAHDHILTLCYLKGQNIPQCNACKQPVRGLAYCCLTCDQFSLHVSCFQLPSKLEHEFHPSHPLNLWQMASDDYFTCNACRRNCSGFGFQCTECGFHLDVECASVKPSLKHPRHEHELAYFKRTTGLLCNACGESSNVDLYRCVSCDYNVHHDCLPLPLTVEQEHIHLSHPLLSLRDKYITKGFDGEQVCNACEGTRNPDQGAYCCEECDFAAHIECVIPTVEPNRKKLVKDTRFNVLDGEIASAKEEIEAMKMQLEALMRKRNDIDSLTVPEV